MCSGDTGFGFCCCHELPGAAGAGESLGSRQVLPLAGQVGLAVVQGSLCCQGVWKGQRWPWCLRAEAPLKQTGVPPGPYCHLCFCVKLLCSAPPTQEVFTHT